MSLTVLSESRVDLELVRELHARGHRVTPQRLIINRVLHERQTHLCAEEVHRETRATLPGVSLPTVYAALELLTELGLVNRIDAGTGTVLFDGRRDPHHHAVCRCCGRVWDLPGQIDMASLAEDARANGLHVHALQALAIGVCDACVKLS